MSTKLFSKKIWIISIVNGLFTSRLGLIFNYYIISTHAFNAHLDNINNVGLHKFIHGETLDLKITSKFKPEQNLSSQKVWNNNNVKLYTFVHGENLNLKITWKFKGTKFVTSKNVGNNNVRLHTFVCGKKLDLETTSELKEAKFVTSKMWPVTTMLGCIPLYVVKNQTKALHQNSKEQNLSPQKCWVAYLCKW
jgi:hypothetical protein